MIIYGSRAKGDFKEGSDIDLTLIGDLNYNDVINLKHEFEDSNIPYLIDLSIFTELKTESLLEHITRVGKVFYEKQ